MGVLRYMYHSFKNLNLHIQFPQIGKLACPKATLMKKIKSLGSKNVDCMKW